MNQMLTKFEETVFSVLPVTILVLFLHFFVAPLEQPILWRFLLGAVVIILGLSIFLLGIDIAIQPVGVAIGSYLTRHKSLFLLLAGGMVLGFFINIAEPDLLVLAKQINDATGGLLSVSRILVVVSVGIGLMLALGLLRIILQVPLKNLLLVIYGVVFLLACLTPKSFYGIAFDAGGATTGSMTVPFILALGAGVSAIHRTKHGDDEDAFGLTAVASGGPMIAIMIMALLSGLENISGQTASNAAMETGIFLPFLHVAAHIAKEVLLAISPLIVISIVAQFIALKLPRRAFRRMLKGFVYTYIGFVFFLTGVNAGFMDAGKGLGYALAEMPLWLNLLVAGIIGLAVILAEPSVHVLTTQVEELTNGAIKKSAILIAFAVGVSMAITLSVLRLRVESMELWIFLLVGYLLAIILSRFTPSLFVGIAFDSGGVASGPMTATFVLSFAQGIALRIYGDSGLIEAFGVIALVALTPLITLQLFGIFYEYKRKKIYQATHPEEDAS